MVSKYKIIKKIDEKIYKILGYATKKLVKNYKNKYLKIYLNGGLCNKLHCLFSACDIALKQGACIIEPNFGWNKKILFSDIYDINHFNKVMSKYNNGKDLMIAKDKIPRNKLLNFEVLYNGINLWNYSEQELAIERKSGMISFESTKLKVLEALKLKPEYKNIVKEFESNGLDTAIQIRTESDWQRYAKTKEVSDSTESVLVSLDTLMDMIPTISKTKNIFYTSGENHQEIQDCFKKINYNAINFFDSVLEYEINAAINFEICSIAPSFIGNSRSSYSNLISLKRAYLLKTDNSFIYNYGDRIYRRVDKGLQPKASLSISKETAIC